MASLSFSPASGTVIPANSSTTFKITVSGHGYSALGGNVYIKIGNANGIDATISGSTATCTVNPYSVLGSDCGGQTVNWGGYFADANDLWGSDWIYVDNFSPPTYTVAQLASLSINTFTAVQQNDGTVKFTCRATGANGSGSITYPIKTGSTTLHSFTGSSGSTVTKYTTIASSLSYGTSYTFTLTASYSTASDATKTATATFVAPAISAPTLSLTGTTLAWTAASFSSYLTGTKTYYLYKDGEEFASTTDTSYSLTGDVVDGWESHTLTVKAVGTDLSNASFSSVESDMSNSVAYAVSSCLPVTSLMLSSAVSYAPVTLEWSGESDGVANVIASYYVQYQDCEDGSSWPDDWIDLETDWPASPLEVSPPDTIGWYRRFRIQVKGSAGEDYNSEWFVSSDCLRKGMPVFEGFTDPELVQSGTKIKACHMTEMQERINNLLLFDGKEAVSFTEIIAGQTKLTGWTAHVTEIRHGIEALGRAPDTWLEIAENRPRVDVMNQLRDKVAGYSFVTISVSGSNESANNDISGCVVTVLNTEDNSVIAEFEYTEPTSVKILPGITWQISCSALSDYNVTPSYGPHTAEACVDVAVELCYRVGYRYGFMREKANSDPSARIAYLYDAQDMTPMTVDLSTSTPDYGSWQTFIDELCRPVMLKTDGTVDYELDHSNQTLKLDGTASDISNTSYDGNAMVEFRKYKWVHRSEDENYEYVVFSDIQWDDTYFPFAHTDVDQNVSDVFYYGMFKGCVLSSKLRSIGTGSVGTGYTMAKEREYAGTNGVGYGISAKSQRDYISDLLTLLSKSDNSDVYGYGICNASASKTIGSLSGQSAFYGTNADQTTDVKVLYIEGFWGNVGERMAGMFYDSSRGGYVVKMTPPYNISGYGYLETGISVPSDYSQKYISESSCTNAYGWLPTAAAGSDSTYYADAMWISTSLVGCPRVGGSYSNGVSDGARMMVLNNTSTYASNYGCARLTYVPVTNQGWDVIWVADGALPPSSVWSYPIGTGKALYEEDYGAAMRLYSNSSSSHTGAAVRLTDYLSQMGQQAILEAEICIASSQDNTGGIRIILGENANGAATGRGLKVVINRNSTTSTTWAHVLSGSEVISTQKNTAEVSLLEWHKIRLELDTINNENKVYLDGTLISTQTNDELSTQDTSNMWIQAYHGSVWVRALRYKKIS